MSAASKTVPPNPFPDVNVEHALHSIKLLFQPDDVIEIRALEVGQDNVRQGYTHAGYFNVENYQALARAIRSVDGRAAGVYVVLNRLNPELLARAVNCLKSGIKHTTTDADIIERRWLYVDIDPVRPAGISSTEAEHGAALDCSATIRRFLELRGWPEPIVADSANGAHLLYRLPELPLDRAGDLVKRCTLALSARFTNSEVLIDQKTCNAARICKLYGTLVRKGDSILVRPHRRSCILTAPACLAAVTVEALEQLAAEVPEPGRVRGQAIHQAGSRFDIDTWLAQSGLEIIKGPEPYDGGRRWTLKSCPFNQEHKKPVVLELASGALVYRCLHLSCASNDWHVLRRHVEPDYRECRSRAAAPNSSTAEYSETSSPWPPPQPILGELPPVEAFCEDLLPVSFRPLVRDVANRMQVPMDYPAAAVVLCLAGAVNRRAVIQPKALDAGWIVVPNLWGGIIGRPGFKKSPAIAAITRSLKEIQAEWFQDFEHRKSEYEIRRELHALELTAWKEQYKAATKRDELKPARPQEASEPPHCKRLTVVDATFEALHQAMNHNPEGVLVLRDELTGWLVQLDKPGREGERAFCLEAWSGDSSFTVDRIGRGTVHVEHCCMSLLGSIQPGRLRSYLTDALRDGPGDDGLIQRFQVLVWPNTPRAFELVDSKPDADAEERGASVFRRLVELRSAPPTLFRFDREAQELFYEWYSELQLKVRDDSIHPALASHLSKYASLMPSLALNFELADQAARGVWSSEAVSLEHAEQAVAWCRYLESHARRVYSCITTPQLRAATELAQRIKRREVGSEGVFSIRDVYRAGWTGLETPELVRQAIEILAESDWIREIQVDQPGKLGRPAAPRYQVNPRVRA